MPAYLGNLGQLLPIKCKTQSMTYADRYSFESTLEGKRKAQHIDGAPRTWDVSPGLSTPSQVSNMFALASGEWGIGPFVWVTADAQVTNMLTPAQASCDPSISAGGSIAGPMDLGEGSFAGRSLINADPSTNMYFGDTPCPVIPGMPVTASGYLLGDGARAGVNFYTATGAFLTGALSVGETGSAGIPKRLSVTATPPDTAAYAKVFGNSTNQGARPALTWTDTLFDWADGEGCPKAVLHGLSRDVLLALREPGYGRYANASFTVSEVG